MVDKAKIQTGQSNTDIYKLKKTSMPLTQKTGMTASENVLSKRLSGGKDTKFGALTNSTLASSLEKTSNSSNENTTLSVEEITELETGVTVFEQNTINNSFRSLEKTSNSIGSLLSSQKTGIATDSFTRTTASATSSIDSTSLLNSAKAAYGTAEGYVALANEYMNQTPADYTSAKAEYKKALSALSLAENQARAAGQEGAKLAQQIAAQREAYNGTIEWLNDKQALNIALSTSTTTSCSSCSSEQSLGTELWNALKDGSIGGALNNFNNAVNGLAGGSSSGGTSSTPSKGSSTNKGSSDSTAAASGENSKPTNTKPTGNTRPTATPSRTATTRSSSAVSTGVQKSTSTSQEKLEYEEYLEPQVKASGAITMADEANSTIASTQSIIDAKTPELQQEIANKESIEDEIDEIENDDQQKVLEEYAEAKEKQSEYTQAANEAEAQAKAKEDLAKSFDEPIENKKTKINGLNGEITTIQNNEVAPAENEVAQAETALTSAQNASYENAAAKEAAISSAQTKLNGAKAKLASAKQKEEAKAKELQQAKDELTVLEEKQKTASDEAKPLRTKATEQQKLADGMNQEVAEKKEAAEQVEINGKKTGVELVEKLNASTAKIESLQKKIDTAKAQQEEARTKFSTAEDLVAKVERNYDSSMFDSAKDFCSTAWKGTQKFCGAVLDKVSFWN